ncbi:Cell shape-determining protein MreB [Fusobacterium sp. DD29]|uniref:rod shape-determining protein n=1 Tax=unclassified Fusobacterium TaxID=2648384 RepID=UPI001B8D5E3E|nr:MULTISPECIES: rod shape-determining protein [unclassified Fusobacterium]MBR8701721.1 Cell shape-determining protein MreB [Fusobacterium sp. DD45]MBR8711493.1 Cell shape-determining protein MreB [Fusobacterium sp. DD28]MBR8749827.1 Cell shape-determining protein MreB [Fusobacterium sp. DD29]MBR8752042.1 Cell shape-determining protein MreB [Fusobacterium sp. DD26]MBR8762069.1 Cell shape-determining protein MreB [Fusobacterium sp. DD25]
MKKIFNKFLGIFSEDLGIDLGTSNTLICVKNKGIILNEPSVVALNTKTKDIFEVGDKAKKMLGRTPGSIETIRPLKNGVIADYEITEKMLRAFYKKVNQRKGMSSPRVIICVPAGVTQVEKRAVIDVTREAGAREAYLIEEPMAAAIGIGLNIFEPEGNLIIDIGGGTSEIAVISLGGIVKTSSFRVAGDKFDATIIDYVRQKHNLLIGERTAEQIKKTIGAVVELEEDECIEISGRNALNGLPRDIKIYSSEVVEALGDLVQQIIEEVKVVLEKTPPELSSDIKRRGIYVTGGGALLRGIDQRIAESLNLNVTVSEDPLNAVINGIQTLLKNFGTYKKVLISPESDY